MPVSYSIEIKDVAARADGAEVAHVRGDLGDLAFWEEGKKPSEGLWIRRGGRFFRARDDKDAGELFFEWPLAVGQHICPGQEKEGPLCWTVEERGKAALGSVAGAPAGEHPAWTLVQRDNTGVQTLRFVPGVGFISYRYHHNGSPSDVDVSLVEVSPGR